MCLSRAFIEDGSNKELLMADVTKLEISGDRLILKSLFGEQKEITGKLESVDFVANTMTVTKAA